MAFTDPKDLGKLIFEANPYIPKGAPKNFEFMFKDTEMSYKGMQWYFKNGSNYVGKAMRIPYCFTDEDGIEVKDYLLIGFEGGGSE